MGMNTSYHSLTGDMSGANYSSLRVASLDEREGWKSRQGWFAASFCGQIYEAWLDFALLKGKIVNEKGKALDPLKVDVYRRVLWLGRRWAWIDPLKEVSAYIQAIIHRLKSRTEVIEEQGGDATATWEQIEAEEAELEELGIELPAQQGGQQTPNQPNVGPDANGNDDPDLGEDPEGSRIKELEHDLATMRSLNRTSVAVIAEREIEIARLKAVRKPRKPKAA
jgi:capsid protein